MVYTLEDGTGIAGGNAYISTTFYKDYWKERGTTITSASGLIQSAIIRASDYADERFQWKGIRQTSTQRMEWPRVSAFYKDGRAALLVPIEVQELVAEYANRSETALLAPDPVYEDTNRTVTRKKEKLEGVGEEDTTYTSGGVIPNFRKYPIADKKVRELIITGHQVLRV